MSGKFEKPSGPREDVNIDEWARYEAVRLPADASLEQVVESACASTIAGSGILLLMIRDVPSEMLLRAADHLREQEGCVGFRVESHDMLADRLQAEVGLRRSFARAKKVGGAVYCPICDSNKCDFGEEHQKNAEKRTPPMSEEDMRVGEMSSDELRSALKEARDVARFWHDFATTLSRKLPGRWRPDEATVERWPRPDALGCEKSAPDVDWRRLAEDAVEELIWCSGSDDFALGGKARIGWEKGPKKVIDHWTELQRAGASRRQILDAYTYAATRELVSRFLCDQAFGWELEGDVHMAQVVYECANKVREVPNLGANELPLHDDYVRRILETGDLNEAQLLAIGKRAELLRPGRKTR